MAPIEYIHRAMNYYIQRFKNIIFIVCSDDVVWTKGAFKNSSSINVELVHGPPAVDLAVLASCNHSIITVGTFGWWAGFLAGGQVIHYKYQAREGTILRKGFSQSMDDYFLPHWISMSWSLFSLKTINSYMLTFNWNNLFIHIIWLCASKLLPCNLKHYFHWFEVK